MSSKVQSGRANIAPERRYFTHKQAKRIARQIDHWQEHQATAYRRELWHISLVAEYAREALTRPDTPWGGHAVARAYLDDDVPRRRRWLHAALHILDFADAKIRADFVLGDDATRERLVAWVIARGGIYDRAHKSGAWVELAI